MKYPSFFSKDYRKWMNDNFPSVLEGMYSEYFDICALPCIRPMGLATLREVM